MKQNHLILSVAAITVCIACGVIFIVHGRKRDVVTKEYNDAVLNAEQTSTSAETLSEEEFEDVKVIYDVPLTNPGGGYVPSAVYSYRLEYHIRDGVIRVTDYEQFDDGIISIHMDVNGGVVTYDFAMEPLYADET